MAVVSALIFNACKPLREFGTMPAYEGSNSFSYATPLSDSTKKTVVIVANNDGTELFDIMAPYYLFNATEKANVYIVAKNKVPIVIKKGFYLLPQNTFSGIDALGIKPDVIVIPFLSAGDSIHQDLVTVNWIRNHYTPSTSVLAICDGAATAAATGIFDGKPITAHASDYEGIRTHFSKPIWTKNVGVVNCGNLYSTAGVSNATDGSLMVINKIFGTETMNKVRENIYYLYELPRTEHQSNTFAFGDKLSIGKKILFSGNKRVGILLNDGINEFGLAAIMDTYNRTFPKSIESFSANDRPIKTQYGLTLIPTGNLAKANLDELHIINPCSTLTSGELAINTSKIVQYTNPQNQYIIDACLHRIKEEYGQRFEKVVKLMLDYN
ncbi:MAG: DJ-1/PfpI family protein [Segetibacter sp.]